MYILILQNTKDRRTVRGAKKSPRRNKEKGRKKESHRGEAERNKGDKGCNLMVNSTYAYKGQSKCVPMA